MTKLSVKDGATEIVRDRWCVTKLYVKDGVTDGVTKMVCDKAVCDKEVCEDAEAEAEAKARAEEAAGKDLQTTTLHNFVGKNTSVESETANKNRL